MEAKADPLAEWLMESIKGASIPEEATEEQAKAGAYGVAALNSNTTLSEARGDESTRSAPPTSGAPVIRRTIGMRRRSSVKLLKLSGASQAEIDAAIEETRRSNMVKDNEQKNLCSMGRKTKQLLFGKSTSKAATIFGISKPMSQAEMKRLTGSQYSNRRKKRDDIDCKGLGTELSSKSSLDEVLNTRVGLEYLKRFSEKEASVENVGFLLKARQFLTKADEMFMTLRREAKEIFNEYLYDEAPQCVNIAGSLTSKVKASLDSGAVENICKHIDECKREVSSLVAKDTFMRFKTHPLWGECRRVSKLSKVWEVDVVNVILDIESGILTGSPRDSHSRLFIRVCTKDKDGHRHIQKTKIASQKLEWFQEMRFNKLPLDGGEIRLELRSGLILDRTVGHAVINLDDFRGRLSMRKTLSFYKDRSQKVCAGAIVDVMLTLTQDFVGASTSQAYTEQPCDSFACAHFLVY
uniref:RGS domain-containing protein n=1 Tax=Lotharella globosa TaxID=91324 RepID=A0A7S3YEF2_9EUKA